MLRSYGPLCICSSLACPAWRQCLDNAWITPNNILAACLYERHYTIQSLTVLMRILLKILKNLNLIDTQTQLA